MLREDVSPVDVNGVHGCLTELGHLEVLLLDVLLVLELAPTVGDKSPSVPQSIARILDLGNSREN